MRARTWRIMSRTPRQRHSHEACKRDGEGCAVHGCAGGFVVGGRLQEESKGSEGTHGDRRVSRLAAGLMRAGWSRGPVAAA